MSDINDACVALADAINTGIAGLRAQPYDDDQVNPPQAHISTQAFDPRLTMGGSPSRAVELRLRVFVARDNPRVAQETLRDYMAQTGSSSIVAAVDDDSNLSTGVAYAEVTQIGEVFEATVANTIFLAVDFDVTVVI